MGAASTSFSSDILDEQEAEFCSTQYSGSEVYIAAITASREVV